MDSDLVKLYDNLRALTSTQSRAQFVENYKALEVAHASVASRGDTQAPDANESTELHYVAFVKGRDGKLYELDGRRVGPTTMTDLSDDEDVLSPKSVAFVQNFIQRAQSDDSTPSFNLSFSLLALAPSLS